MARAAASTRPLHTPHPIDAQVGEAMRKARETRGWRQADLAERLGVTFQQIQKYESGETRLSASTLVAAARALGLPVEAFFTGLPDPVAGSPQGRARVASAGDLLALEEGRELVLALRSLPEDQRRAVLDLMRTLSPRTLNRDQVLEDPRSVTR